MHPTQKPATGTVTGALTGGSDQSPAQTLRAVALYLEQHGWTQEAYYGSGPDLTPSACVLGGIGIVVHGEPVDNPESSDLPGHSAFQAARRTLRNSLWEAEQIDSDWDSVGWWNDVLNRTAEQVIQACRDAADAYDRGLTPGGAA